MNDRELRELLQRNDPAREIAPLGEREIAEMRRVVLRAAPEAPRRGEVPGRHHAPLAWGGVLVTLLVMSAGLWLATRTAAPGLMPSADRPAISTSGPGRSGRTQPGDARPASTRQIQMVTPGGTRVVWVLNSDLKL